MRKKSRAKQKKHHRINRSDSASRLRQAGFISLSRDFMNKNDKIIVLIIGVGIVVLLILSAFLIINRDKHSQDSADSLATPTPDARVLSPYPTIPEQIQDGTVVVNRLTITPQSLTIRKNGTVGFLNEDEIAIILQGVDEKSELLNIGTIQPFQIPTVIFPEVGVFQYINPQNPAEVAEIVVEE